MLLLDWRPGYPRAQPLPNLSEQLTNDFFLVIKYYLPDGLRHLAAQLLRDAREVPHPTIIQARAEVAKTVNNSLTELAKVFGTVKVISTLRGNLESNLLTVLAWVLADAPLHGLYHEAPAGSRHQSLIEVDGKSYYPCKTAAVEMAALRQYLPLDKMMEEATMLWDQVPCSDGRGRKEGPVVFPSKELETAGMRLTSAVLLDGPKWPLMTSMGDRGWKLGNQLLKRGKGDWRERAVRDMTPGVVASLRERLGLLFDADASKFRILLDVRKGGRHPLDRGISIHHQYHSCLIPAHKSGESYHGALNNLQVRLGYHVAPPRRPLIHPAPHHATDPSICPSGGRSHPTAPFLNHKTPLLCDRSAPGTTRCCSRQTPSTTRG